MRKRLTLKDESSTFTATIDARLLDPKPIVHIEPTDLDAEGHYRLPFFCKYVAWFIVLAVVTTSCTLIVLNGEYFSKVKTLIWVAAFLSSFILGAVLLEPARILLLAALKACFLRKELFKQFHLRRPVINLWSQSHFSVTHLVSLLLVSNTYCMAELVISFGKKSIVIQKRKVNPSLVWNPENFEKKMKILNLRQYNTKLYSPTPLYKLHNRLDDIKYQLEMKYVLTDILIHALLFLCNLYLLNSPLNSTPYYNNNAAVEAFLNGRYTRSIKYSSVTTYESFMEYMNETLLPSLFPGIADNTDIIDDRRRRRRSWDSTVKRQTKLPPDKFKKKKLLNYLDKKLHGYENDAQPLVNDTEWTITERSKLLGTARMRQIRVRSGRCKELKYLRPRNIICAPELNLFNVETRNFSVRWKLTSSGGLTERQRSPWEYQSAWKTATLPIFTRANTYPGGGYILELPKNIKDARIILEYMDTFQWVDISTRAIIIEFTLYCANTNLFDVVNLIVEKSATGYFLPRFAIDTFRFILEPTIPVILCTAMCFGLLFWRIVRELIRIYRTSFKIHMNRPSILLDTCEIFFGISRLLLIVFNHIYVSSEVQILQETQNNKFMGFAYASFWFFLADLAGACLMCVFYFQLMRFFSYKVVFYKIHIALAESYKRFLDLLLQKIVMITSFALFFHATFVYRFETFSTLFSAQEALFCRTVVSHNYLHRGVHVLSFLITPILIFLFVVMVSIFSVNAFLVVMCLYYHKVRQVALHERYHFFRFITYCMTFSRQKDIVNFEQRQSHAEVDDENLLATLRLRGGGHKMSRRCKAKEEYEVGGNEFLKVYLENFVTRKLYDTTEYLDLSAERLAALKYLTVYRLSDDARVKTIFSEFALRALYCVVVMRDRTPSEESPQFFFVIKKKLKEVHHSGFLLEMKKTVEDFGKEAGIIRDEYMDRDDVAVDESLEVLDRKLSLLLKKLDSKRIEVDVEKR